MVGKTDKTRAKIVQTAKQLFLDSGYSQTTTADIIDQSGISKGGLYHHFESKELLLKAVHQDIARDIVRKLEQDLASFDGTATQRLQYFFTQQNLYKAIYLDLFSELLASEPESVAIVTARALWGEYEPLLADLLSTHPQPRSAAHIISVMLAELSLQVYRASSVQEIRNIFDAYDRAVSAVAGTTEPVRIASQTLIHQLGERK